MKRTALNALWFSVCTLIIFTLPALADSQVRIVRLSYLNGPVQIDRNTGQGFERAMMNMPVTQGARLRTENGGEAEVEFENGSTVRLTPDSEISFDGLSLLDNGTKLSSMKLDRGVAYFDLDHKDDNTFRLQIGGENLELKKSAHFRVNLGQGQAQLAVLGGQVTLAGPTKTVTVHKKETFTFDTADQTQYALAKGIDEYQFDSWDKQRGQYQDQYARLAYAKGAPYYGWDDLNYYGSFSFVSGWGYMWRPFGVGLGWDPFALGYWAWYPWGYTWVSPYAWGWTPYRYGGWNFVPGYGWGWMPGSGRHNDWYPAPPVNGKPPGWNPPHPPSGGRGGIVTIGHPHPAPPIGITRSLVESTPGVPARPSHRSTVQPLPTPNLDGPVGVVNRGGPKRFPVNPGSNPGRTYAGTESGRQQPSIPAQAARPDAGRGPYNREPNSGASSVSGRSSGLPGGSGSNNGGMGAGRPMGGEPSMRGSGGTAHTGGSTAGRNPR